MTSPLLLSNPFWTLSIPPQTGAISQLSHPADARKMNWVCNSEENPWFLDSHGWGLGFLNLQGVNGAWEIQRWQRPVSAVGGKNTTRAAYRLPALEVLVKRRINKHRLVESFEFRNRTEAELSLGDIGLYSPFNDNYPSSAICIERRCNAHLWCGGNVAWACCLRMGGAVPHLGMVFTEGFVKGYSVEDRGRMIGAANVRGTFVFNVAGQTLAPGASQRIERVFFWHKGWEDFFAQARHVPGFLDVRADAYTVVNGDSPEITANDPQAKIEQPETSPGEHTVKIHYGSGRETWARINVIDDVSKLVRRRVAFICENQQVTDKNSPYYGALLPYDNELDAQFRNPRWPDQNEGRERVGMGVLLAQSLQRWRNAKAETAVKLYYQFVRKKLQKPDGTVLDGVGEGSRRLYNYPWVAQFHLEMFRAFQDERYLTDCFKTLRAYYRGGGQKFYAIGIPIYDSLEVFTATGRKREAGILKRDFLRHGDAVAATGLNFPAHEVNYEQTIVGPATNIALECYLLSRNKRYLECANRLMPALEAFNGRQPDHHLHEIAIRHWDGYWFGKKQIWGDTFPHYWSALTGWVFYRHWQVTGDNSYRHRGRKNLMNNLSAFRTDGRSSCAYLYPDTVNGTPARCWDPLANDQDWALVFLLNAARIDQTIFPVN